jgi:sulfur transfer protein SufE
MVRALALLLAQVYSDSTPLEIVSFHSNLLSEARLTHSITPTRLHGLAQLQKNIRSFARSLLPEAAPPASHGPL